MIIFAVLLSFFVSISAIASENMPATKLAKLIDLNSVPKSYTVYSSSNRDDQYQVSFINATSKQKVLFTFSKYMVSQSSEETQQFVSTVLKAYASGGSGPIQNKITALKKFYANNQYIYYYNVDEYENNKLWCKAIFAFIGNYNGKSIVLQSYGDPKTFNEKEAIDLFSKIKFNTSNF